MQLLLQEKRSKDQLDAMKKLARACSLAG